MTEQHRARMLITELVHLRGELAFLLATLERKGVLSGEEFQREFQRFWTGQGPQLVSQYIEQFEKQWARQEGSQPASDPDDRFPQAGRQQP